MPYPAALAHSRDESETQEDMHEVTPTDTTGLLPRRPKLTPLRVRIELPVEGKLGTTNAV
jgi:hypothetical protein